jgi:hypothetical protein
MMILSQGQVSVWLEKAAAAIEEGRTFPRSMPYAGIRVAQFETPVDDDPLAELEPVDPRVGSEEGGNLARMNAHILRMRGLKPGEAVVNLSARRRAIGSTAKNRANRSIHELTKKLCDAIPLKGIFDALVANGMIPVDDDGSQWSGMLIGGRDCGDPEGASQRADISLAAVLPDYTVFPANVMLHISWCKIGDRYEVTAYVG